MTDPRLAGVRKLSYFMPLSKAPCEACGHTVVYNLAAVVVEHEDEDVVCDRPFPKVERTPEQEARIAAAEAEAVARDMANRERNLWMLINAPHHILAALIRTHGPASASVTPTCKGCPSFVDEYDGELVAADWPCPVWVFVSDRMEKP